MVNLGKLSTDICVDCGRDSHPGQPCPTNEQAQPVERRMWRRRLGRRGFFATSNDGHEMHVNGNPKMADEVLDVLASMLDALRSEECFHMGLDHESNRIYHSVSEHYQTWVCRCPDCGEVEVIIKDSAGNVLGHQRAEVQPYNAANPEAGNAYYWFSFGTWHSTGPIDGLESEKESC